jgi:hypothetical protein
MTRRTDVGLAGGARNQNPALCVLLALERLET